MLSHVRSLKDINGYKLRVEFARIPRPTDRGGTGSAGGFGARDRDRLGRDRSRDGARPRSRSPRDRRRSPIRDRGRDRDLGMRGDGYRDGYYGMGAPRGPGPDLGAYGPPPGGIGSGFQGPPGIGRRALLDTPPGGHPPMQHPPPPGGFSRDPPGGPPPGGPPPSRGGYGGPSPSDDMGYSRGPPQFSEPRGPPPPRDSYGGSGGGAPPPRSGFSGPGELFLKRVPFKITGFMDQWMGHRSYYVKKITRKFTKKIKQTANFRGYQYQKLYTRSNYLLM